MMQKIAVRDARPSEDLLIRGAADEARYRLFPDAAAVFKLYMVDVIEQQAPGFGVWLSDAPVSIDVRIENISGVAETRRSADIFMRYHISARIDPSGPSAINCRQASMTQSSSGEPEALLAADIADNLRQCAETILQAMIRQTAPQRPSPAGSPPLPQITS